MITVPAFESDSTGPVWLVLLPEEWHGPWEGEVRARVEDRDAGHITLSTRYGAIGFPSTAEAAVRARGARIVGAASPPHQGPLLLIGWKEPLPGAPVQR